MIPSPQPRQGQERLCDARLTLSLRLDGSEPITFATTLLRGALTLSSESGPTMETFLSARTASDLILDETDAFSLSGSLRSGAKAIQWTKVTIKESQGNGGRHDWEAVKAKSARQCKLYVCFTEAADEGRITSHYALVLSDARNLNLANIGLGDWSGEAIGMAMVLISMPLTSDPPPPLPNPVRPDFDESDAKPELSSAGSTAVLDTYGLTKDFLLDLEGRSTLMYPSPEGSIDFLKATLRSAFKQIGVSPPPQDAAPEVVIIFTSKLAKAVRSMSVCEALPRRTRFYAVGPTMSLLPSQWTLRPIWQTGGLVTFSPTSILRSPEKFGDIMKTIRASPSWAAYVLPAVIEWANLSWSQPNRCPDPTRAFETLCRALYLDQHLLQFSGSAALSGGRLAVSCAPPSLHLTSACGAWMDWLHRASSQQDFQSLVDICSGVRPESFENRALDAVLADSKPDLKQPSLPLDLVDVEASQLRDLTAMRMQPHLLPYRRYIYVGEVSLDQRSVDQLGAAVSILASSSRPC